MIEDSPTHGSLHKIPNPEAPANAMDYGMLVDDNEISEHYEDNADNITEEVTEDNDNESRNEDSEDNDENND